MTPRHLLAGKASFFLLSIISVSMVAADVENGGFETGNLNGWKIDVEGGFAALESDTPKIIPINDLPFDVFDALSAMRPTVVTGGSYSAYEGQRYLKIPGCDVEPLIASHGGESYEVYFGGSTVFVQQSVAASKKDVLSGTIAFETQEMPSFKADHAFVLVTGPTGSDTAVVVTIADAWGSDTSFIPPAKTKWIHWDWEVPEKGTYMVKLCNTMDDQTESIVFFDAVRLLPGGAVKQPHFDAGNTKSRIVSLHRSGNELSFSMRPRSSQATLRIVDTKGALLQSVLLSNCSRADGTYSVQLYRRTKPCAAVALWLVIDDGSSRYVAKIIGL